MSDKLLESTVTSHVAPDQDDENEQSALERLHGELVEVTAMNDELQARVAELEAQLEAATEWRPVGEVPTETDTLVLMRSYTNRHGYEYKRAIWQNLYENVWKNTVSQQPEGYWFSVEEDEDELDIDEWNEWLPLTRWPAPPQE